MDSLCTMKFPLFALALLACESLLTFVASQGPVYELVFRRDDISTQGERIDRITLQCRNASHEFVPVRDIKFWVNRDGVDDPGLNNEDYVTTSIDGLSIIFQLQLEGNYTCGRTIDNANVMESEIKILIALQTNFQSLRLTTKTTFFAASGSRVTLPCPVQPREQYKFYYGYWTKNGTIIIEILQPTESSVIKEISGDTTNYELDRRTFSLTIKSVNVSRDIYHCVLRNINPLTRNTQEFTQAASIDIMLMVNESPTILKGPEPFVVGLQDARTTRRPTFKCSVGGAPRPLLVWSYIPNLTSESKVFLDNQSEDYNITYDVREQSNGRSVVNSTFTFLSTTNTDGGIVRCNAGLNPVSATADALLTVLGRADNIDVFVTKESVVIYEMIFPVVLWHPVKLSITYIAEAGDSKTRLIDIEYNNSNTITYKETNKRPPPYPVYYVNISLVAENGNERLYGPSTMKPEKIDTTTINALLITGLVLGLLPLALVVALLIVVIVAVLTYKHLKRSKKLESIHKIMNSPMDSLKDLSEEDRQRFLRNVTKAHIKVLFPKETGHIEFDCADIDPITSFAHILWDSFVQEIENDTYKKQFIDKFKRLAQSDPEVKRNINDNIGQPGDESVSGETDKKEKHGEIEVENSTVM